MKSLQYLNRCNNNLYLKLFGFPFFRDYENIQNLHIFLRDYDLIDICDNFYIIDLHYFLTNGKFYDLKIDELMINKNNNDKSLRKDINTDFYEGFNN